MSSSINKLKQLNNPGKDMGRRDAFRALLLEFLRKYCMEHEEVFDES